MRYGYARVSTGDQDLTIQREALKAVGCVLIREEKVSGASRDGRDELKILLDFARDGDVIVVTKLDRLARNTLDMLSIIAEIGAKGIGFQSIAEPWADTTSPAGKLMLTVMAGVAEFERERIKERQREGIARAKAEGRFQGAPKRFDPEKICELYAGGMRPRDIKAELGCSEATIFRALKDANIDLKVAAPPGGEIAAARPIVG